MTAELCKWELKDPLTILISREQAAIKRSCAGCSNAKPVLTPFGETVTRCLKGRPYGKKCSQFVGGVAK
ncbi:hypothetical protein [Bordetella genomosp. 4]|uniref:Uncharacterized protein n=1 Tax=Bordetella genomosp. 4 TaxID=463044 RepID=A0A261U7C3_9BORD|nr:hypothetical protein [Bordetella genomosp. 4]OZI56753.1 hypothetical protein CAL20_15245 [Bordetella genomosp. 4]